MTRIRRTTAIELLAESLRRTGGVSFRVQGSSMRPWVRGGDVVHLERSPLSEIRRGDVVAFQRCGALVVHRVIGVRQSAGCVRLQTKGDAFADADGPVDAGEYLARVHTVERAGRKVSLRQWPQRLFARSLALVSGAAPLWFRPAQRICRTLRAGRVRMRSVLP